MLRIRGVRCAFAWSIAILSVGALTGCSDSQNESPPTTTSTYAAGETTTRSESAISDTPTTATPVERGDINIARLNVIRGAFPADFPPGPPREPTKEASAYAHLVGGAVSFGKPFTVDPPQCRALLDPVDGQAGAESMLVGAQGPAEQVISVIVSNPVTVPAGLPSTGCERLSFHVENDVNYGTAARLAAPNIDGAVTSAIKVIPEKSEFVEFNYIAILDGRVFIEVVARVHPNFQAEPLLPDLLSKGVAAIRG
jgi:hypothetical protein